MAENPSEAKQITLGGEVETETDIAPGPKLVFLGISVVWRKRVSDFSMSTEIAESWEEEFTYWEIDGRTVHLGNHPLRYQATLRDGEARFVLDGPTAWRKAADHVQVLLGTLRSHGREGQSLRATTQHLAPVEDDFDSLVSKLADRLFNTAFYRGLGEPADIAYLVDVLRDGVLHNIQVGPLRAHEVSARVAARRVDHIPERSIFVDVTATHAIDDEVDVKARLEDLRDFSFSLIEDLTS